MFKQLLLKSLKEANDRLGDQLDDENVSSFTLIRTFDDPEKNKYVFCSGPYSDGTYTMTMQSGEENPQKVGSRRFTNKEEFDNVVNKFVEKYKFMREDEEYEDDIKHIDTSVDDMIDAA